MSDTMSAKKIGKLFEKCHNFTKAEEVKAAGIYPYFNPIEDCEGPEVMMGGKKVVMAGSNNYLGLTTHPKVKEAAIKAIEKFGTSCSGSRYLTGTIDMHNEFEYKVAKFVGKEAALLFSTGYQAGQGVIAPLVGRGDFIISDKENHASIQTSNAIAKGIFGTEVIRYHHADMNDLRHRMEQIKDKPGGKIIVTDGVFSAFGDIPPLDEMNKIAKKYGAQLLVDDAHAFGVIGEGGRGTASHFGLTDDVDLILCTFSKTLASLGGFVAGDERVINYLKHHSPALIFSASITPASIAAAIAALEILIEHPELPLKLVANTDRVRQGLVKAGFRVMPPDAQAAIVSVIIGDNEKAFIFWKKLFDAGIFVNVFVAPATPPNMAMMRNSFMATHNNDQLDFIIDTYIKVGKELGII
jgi:8-amino-7-oxononanoate synthase